MEQGDREQGHEDHEGYTGFGMIDGVKDGQGLGMADGG